MKKIFSTDKGSQRIRIICFCIRWEKFGVLSEARQSKAEKSIEKSNPDFRKATPGLYKKSGLNLKGMGE